MKMKIYGPILSWRLGKSLGVDLVNVPEGYGKICSLDCVYCYLGENGYKTNKLQKMPVNEKEFELLERRIEETKPDYITFSGRGEPILNLNLGYVAERIKQMTDIPIAVLTSASFVNDEQVREGLNKCDLIIPKIDAPNQELFEKINRPYDGISLSEIIEGIKLLKTNVAIQTLFFSYKGLTNADNKTVKELIEVYKDINKAKPIGVFLCTAYRESGIEGLNVISEERLEEIASQIVGEIGDIVVKYYRETESDTKKDKT